MMDLDDVKLPDDAGYYLCGPLPFMRAVRSALIDRGVAAARHPVRGVRSRPVAGRPRHRGDPGRLRGLHAARLSPPPSTVRPARAHSRTTHLPRRTRGHSRDAGQLRQGRRHRGRGPAVLLLAPVPQPSRGAALFPVSMAHQRDRLFAALGDVVARVDDLEALVPILQQLGRDHRKFGTVAAHYPAVGASLLATLEHFDDEWTPELAKSWSEAYDVVATVMIEAAEAAAEEPAWWEADVVGPRAAHHRRRRPAGAPPRPLRLRGRAVGLPGDRPAARSCGATTPPPTPRGRTA